MECSRVLSGGVTRSNLTMSGVYDARRPPCWNFGHLRVGQKSAQPSPSRSLVPGCRVTDSPTIARYHARNCSYLQTLFPVALQQSYPMQPKGKIFDREIFLGQIYNHVWLFDGVISAKWFRFRKELPSRWSEFSLGRNTQRFVSYGPTQTLFTFHRRSRERHIQLWQVN